MLLLSLRNGGLIWWSGLLRKKENEWFNFEGLWTLDFSVNHFGILNCFVASKLTSQDLSAHALYLGQVNVIVL